MTKYGLTAVALAIGGCAAPADTDDAPTGTTTAAERGNDDCTWDQWGQSASHDGSSCARGQRAKRSLAEVTFDPFVPQEAAEEFGDLFVHYQVPLTDDDDNVFMMRKSGTYVSCDPPGSSEPFPCGIDNPQTDQIWNEQAYRWHGSHLEPTWSFQSDWKPFQVFLWEPMFQPTLAGPFIYIPGAGGSVWQLDKRTGHTIRKIDPFADPNSYVSGGITADREGNIYWNVIHHDPNTFLDHGSLVKASPFGHTRVFSYNDVPGAPGEQDLCYYTFFATDPQPPLPWPPADQPDGSPTLPPQFLCGAQRPGVNVTPTIGRDGTIYTASAASFNNYYSYVVALKPDLTAKWATSLRDRLADGCGVGVPYGTTADFNTCREGAALGVDPFTNMTPAWTVDDDASSSPVALPDGSVLYGALGGYNGGRGHLVKLDHHGNLTGTFDFGWDVTPAVYEHDHTYSIIVKDNHYATNGPYYITQLSKDLEIEWSYQNTSTQACTRNPDGTITCSDTSGDGETHPDGFEWCINAPAVDANGVVYATSEDGSFYSIEQGGTQRDKVFLDLSIGAAYTPLSLDPRGRIYTLNNGKLTVLGQHP